MVTGVMTGGAGEVERGGQVCKTERKTGRWINGKIKQGYRQDREENVTWTNRKRKRNS